jgi:RNA polymerase sigma factor (sigma-70 family)
MTRHVDLDGRRNDGLRACFDESSGQLRRLISARLGNQADAEDLMQELWIKLATIETSPVDNPHAYLYRMALNLANDLIRQRIRRSGRESAWSETMISEEGGLAVDPSPSPERALGDKMRLDLLKTAIIGLPDRAGEVFRRHRIEGSSHSEVAQAMGISRSGVEKHMATAMKYLLRAMMDRDET